MHVESGLFSTGSKQNAMTQFIIVPLQPAV